MSRRRVALLNWTLRRVLHWTFPGGQGVYVGEGAGLLAFRELSQFQSLWDWVPGACGGPQTTASAWNFHIHDRGAMSYGEPLKVSENCAWLSDTWIWFTWVVGNGTTAGQCHFLWALCCPSRVDPLWTSFPQEHWEQRAIPRMFSPCFLQTRRPGPYPHVGPLGQQDDPLRGHCHWEDINLRVLCGAESVKQGCRSTKSSKQEVCEMVSGFRAKAQEHGIENTGIWREKQGVEEARCFPSWLGFHSLPTKCWADSSAPLSNPQSERTLWTPPRFWQ